MIIGIMAAIAVPQFKRSIITTRGEAVANDLRVYTQAFQQYLQDRGDWPQEDSLPGFFPPGMESYLRESNWTRPTPIGGYYVWNSRSLHVGSHIRASISINSSGESQVSSDPIQLENIDRRLDDGNLVSGSLRLGFNREPLWIIEQ